MESRLIRSSTCCGRCLSATENRPVQRIAERLTTARGSLDEQIAQIEAGPF